MGTHSVQVTIKNNLPAGKLQYSMEISRKNSSGTVEIALPNTGKLPLQGEKTSTHQTVNLLRQTQVNFILTLTLYAVTRNQRVATLRIFKKVISFPNESSANKDIKFKYKVKQFSCDETYQNIQACVVTLLEEPRPYLDPQYPFGSEGDPYREDFIDREINQRLAKQTLPNQGYTSLCGPAAFWYCLLQDQPDIYAQAARDLWKYGKTKIGTLEIDPSNANKTESRNIAQYDINGLDWMTLAGLRDEENTFKSVTNASGAAGMTTPSDLRGWFKDVGAQVLFDNTASLVAIGLKNHKTNYSSVEELNAYISKGNCYIVSLIDANLLNTDRNIRSGYQFHWIVWKSSLEFNGSLFSLSYFSWGNDQDPFPPILDTKQAFLKYFYGGFVVSHIP